MFYYNRGYGRASKLSSLWHSLMIVIEKTGPDSYTLKDIENRQLVNCVHAKYMGQVLQ